MRKKLDWRNRIVGDGPKITTGIHLSHGKPGRTIWVSKKAEAYIYNQGRNPFGRENDISLNTGFPGIAGTARDEFELAHERPYAKHRELRRLGITQSDA